jgi:hypothetical protein
MGGVFAPDDWPPRPGFQRPYSRIHPRLQELFGTRQPVFLSTSSAWGVMEAADPECRARAGALLHVRRVLG